MSPSRGPARSGRRNPALLNPPEQPESTGALTQVYVACRPLPMGDYIIPVGTEVPGAGEWQRIEAWVNARRVRQVRADEEYQTYEEFVAAEDERAAAELEAAEKAQEPAAGDQADAETAQTPVASQEPAQPQE